MSTISQQEVSNLSAKVLKLTFDAAKCEEASANILKMGASIKKKWPISTIGTWIKTRNLKNS